MTKILTKQEYNKLPEDERPLYDALYTILQAKEGIENNIYKLGFGLYQAKQLVAHGEWEEWLRNNVDFSVRTAQRYIKTYKEFTELQCTYEELDTLNDNKILVLLDIKKDDREDFIKNSHEVQGIEKTIQEMSVVELEDTIKEYKKLKKQPKKNIKNDTHDVFETESDNKVIDVDFKESHETEQPLTGEQKLSQLIKEQQELEQQLKMKQRQAKEIKTKLVLEKNINLDAEFEEVVNKSGLTWEQLTYKIYIVRGSSKELIMEKIYAYWFEDIAEDENNLIINKINYNEKLMQKEKEWLIAKCKEFKNNALLREKEIKKENNDRFTKKFTEGFTEAFSSAFNISNQKQEPQSSKDLKKEFIIAGYKALAKKYHPDCNLGDAEAEDKFKAIGIFKDILLQQNLLN